MNQSFPSNKWERVRVFSQGQVRSMFRCKKTLVIGNSVVQCKYICRSDRPKEATHTCSFDGIDSYFERESQFSDLQKSIYAFIANSNISFSAVASPSFVELIHRAIKEGQESVLKQFGNNLSINYLPPEKIYHRESRQTIARKFNEYAQQRKNQRLSLFKSLKYASLAIDAGKINGLPILDITIVNSFSSIKPLLVRAIRFFSGTTEEYIEKVSNVIQELHKKGIIISSIVGDNLRAQKSAFNGDSSMQANNPKTFLAKPIWFSCICHTISLAIHDAINENQNLHFIHYFISDLSRLMRSKPMVSSLGILCPDYCSTRWTIEYDILYWVISHFRRIEEVFLNPPPNILPYLLKMIDFPNLLYINAPIYLRIFGPVRDLITFLEGDNSPAVYVFPIIEDFTIRMKKLIDDNPEYENDINSILNNISNRLNMNYSFFLLRVLFYLTPSGRDHARMTVFNHLLGEIPDRKPNSAPTIINPIDSSKKIDELIACLNPSQEKINSMTEVFSKIQDNEDLCDAHNNEEEDIIEEEFEHEEERMCDLQEISEYLNCIYEIAIKYSYSFSSDKEEQIRYADRMVESFMNWILNPITDLSLTVLYNRDAPTFWREAKKHNEYKKFASFVLRILPKPASEATVERNLWRQRVVTPPDRSSSSETTQLNRVLLCEKKEWL